MLSTSLIRVIAMICFVVVASNVVVFWCLSLRLQRRCAARPKIPVVLYRNYEKITGYDRVYYKYFGTFC